MPKDARRHLIPLGETAAQFLDGAVSADAQELKGWLREARGIPDGLLRFDRAAVPAHLVPELAVTVGGEITAHGKNLAALRRETAAAARAELERHARAAYGSAEVWRRFEIDALPESLPLTVEQGTICVYPTLERTDQGLGVRYEWSLAEAARRWRQSAPALARSMLSAQARDLGKLLAADSALLLAASPYAKSADLIETLLQLAFRRACFADAAAPRARDAYNQAVAQGRARLHPCLDEIAAAALNWYTEARAVRRRLVEPGLQGGRRCGRGEQ